MKITRLSFAYLLVLVIMSAFCVSGRVNASPFPQQGVGDRFGDNGTVTSYHHWHHRHHHHWHHNSSINIHL